jgi:hypothetical protein
VPQATFGTTTFTWPEVWGQGARIKIGTQEGSTIAVPEGDLLGFLAGAYVLPMRRARDEQKSMEQVLLGG